MLVWQKNFKYYYFEIYRYVKMTIGETFLLIITLVYMLNEIILYLNFYSLDTEFLTQCFLFWLPTFHLNIVIFICENKILSNDWKTQRMVIILVYKHILTYPLNFDETFQSSSFSMQYTCFTFFFHTSKTYWKLQRHTP